MPNLLELNEVTKSFGGLVAVKNLSFHAAEGDVLGLIGPNGSGKTTVFNLVSGIYKPDSGVIRFEGRLISGLKPHKVTSLGISRTFQIVRPFAKMSTIENVVVGLLFGKHSATTPRKAGEEAIQILRKVSLQDKAMVLAGTLTLAQQRRLELARALASSPRLLMLDEVMAGLSYSEMSAMVDVLKRIQQEQGITLIIVEHVMKAIVNFCTRIVVMNEGEKLVEGTPSEVMREERVIAAYTGRR